MGSNFDKAGRRFVILALVGTALIMGFNFYTAHHVSAVLPIVDGWAVWDRVLRLNAHEITWWDYLFNPHGAHLHSIVYLIAWWDYRFSGADQQLMQLFSFSAAALFATAASWLMWKWGALQQKPLWLRVLACLAAVALLTSVIDFETLLQPFQVVLSVSRFFYFALLGAIVIGLVYRKPVLYALAIVVSMVAVSFHGSGYLFAGLVVVAHLILVRKPAAFITALLPLVAVFAFQKTFGNGGGELSQLDKILTPNAVLSFMRGASAYFSMPFRTLELLVGIPGIVLLGLVLMLMTVGLTLGALRAVLRRTYGLTLFGTKLSPAAVADRRTTAIAAMVFLTGLFLLLSAAAAAVFWIVRTAAAGSPPVHWMVLGSTRYTAYSTVAVVMLLGYAMTFRKSVWTTGIAVASVVLMVIALWPATHINKIYPGDDDLNRAAAALSVGISPLHKEAEAVWPMAEKDWYWSTHLPKTIVQLRLEQKSAWKDIPPMGAIVDGPLTPLPVALIHVRTLDRLPQRCGLGATLPAVPSQSSASAIVAIVSGSREVVGYAARMRREFEPNTRRIDGFVLCEAGKIADSSLYMADLPSRWHGGTGVMETLGSAANVTDVTWLNGVAKGWSGFFVESTPEALKAYAPGTMLRVPDGQLKVVTRTSESGAYLNVFLDGPPIDGNVNGYPYRMQRVR